MWEAIELQRTEADNKRNLSIPAQVFLNHFQAICSHLTSCSENYDFRQIPYFEKKLFSKKEYDFARVKRVLYNSWSSEHALHLTGKQGLPDYYKYALHWSFPQAYYSCYLNMHAFCLATGDLSDSHSKIILGFGERVKRNVYPKCISFYAEGNYKNYNYGNLPLHQPKKVLSLLRDEIAIQSQIASFLKSTRSNKAEYHRDRRQRSANPILTNGSKQIAKKFNPDQWHEITKNLGPTSLFDILYRLRIKANYNDIETFMHADINFQQFHECLTGIVGYLNFVHECYLAKAIGYKKYEIILNSFPAHLSDSFVKRRYEEHILNLIR